MIRVAVVMGKMHSGGKKNLVMEYYRHINRDKVQFDFICDADSNSIPKEEIEELGGRVYIISPYQHIIQNMRQIYSICKKNRYTIVHGYNGTMNVFAMVAAKAAGVPIRINESISMAHSGDRKTFLKNILKPFSRFCSTNYMANGEECGKWQFGEQLYLDGKVAIFKTVINAKKNSFDSELRIKTRKEYDIENCIIIGHIGRLTVQKNTLFLIDIFNEIAKKEPKARLLLIGDGELREAMLERINKYGIQDRVIYLGRREDIHQFYNAMDCFLLPSLYEGLPVVGVEAECCGLPVFFSKEIPEESSPCADLGHFVGLDQRAEDWAAKVLKYTEYNMMDRRDHSEDIIAHGFDSGAEAKKLEEYYSRLLENKR